MRAHCRKLLPAAMTILLAACAGTPTTDVDSHATRPPAPTAQPGDTRPVPAAPAPMPSVTRKGGGYYKDDGPGDNPPPDMASIPDADPKLEPLHRFANRPYAALGQNYVPRQELTPYKEIGIASWYGRRFHGARTSSGERYDMYGMTAAHPTLPIPSYARVTNVANGKTVVVRINDRGPFHNDRVIDLSYTAAWKLGYVSKGSTRVEVEAIVPEGVTVIGKSAPPAPNVVTATPLPQEVAVVSPAPAPTASGTGQAVLAPPVAEVAAPPVSTPPAGIYLQLGAFSSNRNAEDFRAYALQELGNLKQQLFVVEDQERFRLQLGPFSSADAAREMSDRVAGRLKLKPFVVQR
ncbi:septal ring lytic transglycosylase RlpA family protein [Uliginosibacterium sp. H3]|uniref:Endolytic peptidoglycan transglycosylase RlpA n=1 Tax=Uliginosibacterium silvisoli TaxID=3114758 RepID=A0ABU6JZG8_9RHOO|nr:septal ring lytic transglycosylase RlpA family protein [Uliginosibacterium sp. H3]